MSKYIGMIGSILKVFIFLSFVGTAAVMYALHNWIVGNFIILAIGEFLLYNKVDALERKFNGGQ